MINLESGGIADYGLKTISKDGEVPRCRMSSAANVQDMGRRLWTNDEKRAFKRAKVFGIVAGFPPYSNAVLRGAGRAEACNANFNTANGYMENGSGAFYDLFSEAPGYVGIKTSHGEDDERKDEYSRIMSEEADRIIGNDPLFDYEMQQSIWNMVLYGCGPLIWEDVFRVFPVSVNSADFKVPERTKSDSDYYELVWIDRDYYPPQLFEFIENEEAARKAGWDVEYTKEVISNAMQIRQPDGRLYDWEWYATELKTNAVNYLDDTLVCRVGICFWKEFNGRISQAIVERENTGTTAVKYMFIHVGRYENFRQCVAPMYYDRGNGGLHHSVTGMGTKMYSAIEFENRLLCRLMDGAFAPKILFKPTSSEAAQKMQLAHLGDYGVVPAGWDMEQIPIQGFISEGLEMFKASSDLMRSNLSAYRNSSPMKQSGNPLTAKQVMYDASQQSALNKTTFNRYYRQLDLYYGEVVRRLCNFQSNDKRAEHFQTRCHDRGVPRECFGRLEMVRAVRVVGEGSAFMRKQSVAELMNVAQGFPEEGHNNWLNDMIAATAGQSAVNRYNPDKARKKLADDQTAEAMLQVAGMKIGVAPVVTSTQKPLRYAGIFLKSSVDALETLKQGANPQEVVKFLDLSVPACIAQVKRVMNDPIRKMAGQAILDQAERMGKIVDQIKRGLAQQQQQQAQLRKQQQDTLTDQQIRLLKVKGDLNLKSQKQQASLAMQSQKHRQNLAIADATAASQIHRENALATLRE